MEQLEQFFIYGLICGGLGFAMGYILRIGKEKSEQIKLEEMEKKDFSDDLNTLVKRANERNGNRNKT